MLRDLLLFYHELDYYFIEKENQDLEWRSENEITKQQKLEEKLDNTERNCKYHKNTNVVNFHSLCDFVYGCHNDRIKFTVAGFCSCLLSE